MEQEEWGFLRQFIHKMKTGNQKPFKGPFQSHVILQQTFYSPAAQAAKNFSLLHSFFAIRCVQFLYF